MGAMEVILTKRDDDRLGDNQIDWVIRAYTGGVVADGQMSALVMAILFNGMNRDEISCWAAVMIISGQCMDFSSLSRPTADKHPTDGVGDRITLPLAPLVAAFDVVVPQLSGYGLEHTDDTFDKMELAPGWYAVLGNEELPMQLADVGVVVCTAGSGLTSADKRLYTLRDAAGTVEAILLIVLSIMSRKIAKGTRVLVLDAKIGLDVFMKTRDHAEELARIMMTLRTDANVSTVALLINMNTPLGRTAGNALEVRESLEVLADGGPRDVVELTVRLAHEILTAAGKPDVDPVPVL